MRKITSLFNPGVRVYLFVRDREIDSRFRRQAKQEGVKILGENGLYIFWDKRTLLFRASVCRDSFYSIFLTREQSAVSDSYSRSCVLVRL